MAKDKTMGGFLPFGFQNLNPNKPNGMFDIWYSIGGPVLSRNTDTGMTNIYQNMFNKNLSMGRDPYTGFPAGWGSGQQSTTPEPTAQPPVPPTAVEPFIPPEMLMAGGLSGNPMGTDWRQTMLMALFNPKQTG